MAAETTTQTFGSWLQAAIGDRRDVDVYRAAGIPDGNFYQMLRGKRYPSAPKLRRLCETLGKDFDEAAAMIAREKSIERG
jgi:predicted transcriptional regulator